MLFIIVAVYVNKMKKLPPEAFTQQQMGYAGAQPYANQGAYQAPQPGYYQQPYVQPGQNPYAQGTPQQPYGQPYEQTRKASPSTSSSRPKTPRRTTSNHELGSRTIRQNAKSPHIQCGLFAFSGWEWESPPRDIPRAGVSLLRTALRFRRRPHEAPSTRTPSSPNSQDLSRYAFASGEGTT